MNCAAADPGGGAERAGVLLHRAVAPSGGGRQLVQVAAGGRRWWRRCGRVPGPREDDRRGDRHADAVRTAGLPAVRDGRAGRQRDGRGGAATSHRRRILVRGRYVTTAVTPPSRSVGRVFFPE